MPPQRRISKSEEFQNLRNSQLKGSDPLQYNAEMCKQIKNKTDHIVLPKLSNDDMSKLKEHLIEYKKIPRDELQYKFLNLYNSFTLIYKFEDSQEMKRKIEPILIYLKNYTYIINLIIENQDKKDTPILDKAMIMLHLEINMFCMQYAYILSDIDNSTINWEQINPEDDITPIDDLPEEGEDADPFSQYEEHDEEEQ